MSRETRLYRYLCQNPDWQPRDKIMHWTGYPSPKNHPVIAYVEFQNDVMRLNAQLAREGKQVIRNLPSSVEDRPELYRLA